MAGPRRPAAGLKTGDRSLLQEVEIFPNIYDNQVIEESSGINVFEFASDVLGAGWVNDITVLDGEQYCNVKESILSHKIVSFNSLGTQEKSVEFRVSPQPSFNKNFQLLLEDINRKISEGYTIFISSENERQFERLRNIFTHNSEESILKAPKFIELNCSLHTGFVDTVTKNCLYTDHQIFNRYHRVKIKREVPRMKAGGGRLHGRRTLPCDCVQILTKQGA